MMKTPLTMSGPGKGKGRGKGRGRGRPSQRQQQQRLDFNLGTVVIHRKYPGDVIAVNENKLRDLELLMPYMPDEGRVWIREFLDAQRKEDADVQQDIVQQDDDPDDDFAMDYEDVRCIAEAA